MKMLRTLLFTSLLAVPAFAQSAGDVLQTRTRARDQLRDGSCDGSQKRLRVRDLAASQARAQARAAGGQRAGTGRMGR